MNNRVTEVEAFIESVDQNGTRENARRFLSKYRHLARMAGKTLTDLQSPAITDMPRGGSIEQVEDKIIRRLDAKAEVKKVETALSKMDPANAQIIYLSYMAKTYHTMEGIALLVNLSTSALRHHKNKALIEFAECYDGGILLEME